VGAPHRNRQARILWLYASHGPTSIPEEMATALDENGWNIHAVAYYASRPRGESRGRVKSKTLDARWSLDPRAPLRLARLLARARPDILHVHHTVPSLAGLLIGRRMRIPIIVATEHRKHDSLGRLASVIAAWRVRRVECAICNSLATYSSIPPSAIEAGENIQVIHNGVSIADINAPDRRGRIGPLVFGCVARLVGVKNPIEVVRAFARLIEAGVEAIFVWIGDGPLRSDVEREVRRQGLEGRFQLLGEVGKDSVSEWLAKMDVFVMFSSTEGFCNSVVEAMGAGLPCIVSDAGALPEVVGDVAIIIPSGDANALCEEMTRLSTISDAERHEMGSLARGRAISRFNLEIAVRRYGALYERLLNDSAARTTK
jgi:glycosyltransferase involved in cell wall biosynthesis